MATGTFETIAFPFTIGMEGGWGNDPRDRGNWTSGVVGKGINKGTKYGIAAHVYPTLDIKNLTLAQAEAIYKRDYADKVAYDSMPPGIDISVWDMGVNAGPARSLSLLASALNSNVKSAAGLANLAQAAPDKVAVIKGLAARRLSFYRGLSTFKTFGKGWTRRAAECEALSVKTWLTLGAKKLEAEVKKDLRAEAKKADTASKTNAGGGVVTGTAAATTPHDWTFQFDWTTAIEIAAVIAVVGVIFVLIWKAKTHRGRAKAYAAIAQ